MPICIKEGKYISIPHAPIYDEDLCFNVCVLHGHKLWLEIKRIWEMQCCISCLSENIFLAEYQFILEYMKISTHSTYYCLSPRQRRVELELLMMSPRNCFQALIWTSDEFFRWKLINLFKPIYFSSAI